MCQQSLRGAAISAPAGPSEGRAAVYRAPTHPSPDGEGCKVEPPPSPDDRRGAGLALTLCSYPAVRAEKAAEVSSREPLSLVRALSCVV